MTADAFPSFQQRVHKTPFQSFIKSLVTFQAYLPLGAEFELELILSVSWDGIDKKSHDAEQQKGSVSIIYLFYFHVYSTTWQS